MRRFFMTLYALVALAMVTTTAFAASGKLTGKVVDAKTGEPIVGASVSINGTQLGAAVDIDGIYNILNIPPGTYDVTVTGVGYTKTTVRGVLINTNLTTYQNFSVEPASVGLPEVVVEAPRKVIDITQTTGRSIMTSGQIQALPAANLKEIMATSPSAFNGYVRGGKRFETAYIVDGIDLSNMTFEQANAANGLFTSYLGVNLSFRQNGNLADIGSDALQEVSVNTSSDLQYAPASAGIVNMTLKEGTGRITGQATVKYASSLNAAGPNVYTGILPDGTTPQSKYIDEKAALNSSGNTSKADRYTWIPGEYWYGNKPTTNAQFNVGGGITKNLGFMVDAKYINSYGMYPNDFNRSLDATATVDWSIDPTLKLTGIGILSDQGYFLGWRNSMYNENFKFFLQGVPRYAMGTAAASLKLTNTISSKTYYNAQFSYTDSPDKVGFITNNGQINPIGATTGNFITFSTPDQLKQYISDINLSKFFSLVPQNETPSEASFPSSGPYKLSRPGAYYENQDVQQYNLRADINSQVNPHHLLSGGFNIQMYDYHNLRRFSPSGYLDTEDYTVHPKEYGAYIQDRMNYSGLIVNAGLRVDGWDAGAKGINNFFAPYTLVPDSEVFGGVNPNGTPEVVHFNNMVVNRTRPIPVKWLFEPQIGISHPISDRASMYYSFSRTMQPLPFSALYGISYSEFHTSLPNVTEVGQDPMQSTNYEMGLQYAVSTYFGINLSAYYRTIQNYNQMAYEIVPRAGIASTYYLYFYGGNADARGVELTLRSNALPLSHSLSLTGVVTYSYSYVRALVGGTPLRGQNNFAFFTTAGDSAKYAGGLPFANANYMAGFEQAVLGSNSSSFGGYDRPNRLTLILNFDWMRPFSSVPVDFHLNTFTTYESGFLYPITIADPRSREIGTAPFNLRTDMRFEADFKAGVLRIAPFVEVLNLFNRLNVMAYDNSTQGQILWEEKGIPTGPYGQVVLPDGTSVYDIGRTVYFGVSVDF